VNQEVALKSSDYRFIGNRKNSQTGWHSYKFAADIDCVSFFMQYHIGILPIGTVGWMLQQAVEKYCKAILNKADPNRYSESVLAKKPFSHDLRVLWDETKSHTSQFFYESAYEDLVSEVNAITTDTRYLTSSMGLNLGMIEAFTVLCCEFRFELLGVEEFHSRFFGLQRDLILPRVFLDGYSFEDLFKKLMHMSIDHGVSFSGMGSPDTYEWTKVELSRATAKFCQCGKHIDVEKGCPICCKTIWTDGRRHANDAKLLREYFGT